MTDSQTADSLRFFQPRESKPCELSEFDKLEADRERLLILTGMAAPLYDRTLRQQITDALIATVRDMEARMRQ
ncbi:hypothetical protein [Nitrosospira multiformis]|uniref:hypothetical protein n=1 Tax=Nitrosospira multiformis TaxID=1231 RepID=UPI0011B23F9B|nr:hypothetical protein [Nitrosospira multiformis]